MSCREVVIKIKHIIIGNYKRFKGDYSKEALRRYKICMKCTDKGYIKGFGDYCTHCGCPIKSKITVNNEQCKMNKW